MPSTTQQGSVDRRAARSAIPVPVQVALVVCGTVLLLALLGAVLYLLMTDQPVEPFLEAISGPTGVLAIIGIVVSIVQNARLKPHAGRPEALTAKLLPELVRERTAPLEHATPVAPVVVPAPAAGTGQVREVTQVSVPFEEVIRPTATLPAQPAPAPPQPAPSPLLPIYPGIPRADYVEDLDAESTHDGIPAHQEVG